MSEVDIIPLGDLPSRDGVVGGDVAAAGPRTLFTDDRRGHDPGPEAYTA